MNIDLHITLNDSDSDKLNKILSLLNMTTSLSYTITPAAPAAEAPAAPVAEAAEAPAAPAAPVAPVAEAAEAPAAPAPAIQPDIFSEAEPEVLSSDEKISMISELLHTAAKNGKKANCRELMMKFRVPALSRLNTLTDEELDKMLASARGL